MKKLIIFELAHQPVSAYQLVFIAAIVLLGLFLGVLLSRFFARISVRHKLPAHFSHFVRQAWYVLVIILCSLSIMEVLDIDYTSVLQHSLYKTDKFTFRVYSLVFILIIVFFIRIIVFLTDYLMELRIRRKKIDRGRGRSLLQIVKYVIWIIGLTICFSSLGIKMTLVIASVSALLVGVGFGLQHIFNDFFSGIIILFDGSIEVDDVVELDNVVGRVLDIGLRVSKIITRDNFVIIVPNSELTGDKVINWTHNEQVTRFHVNVGVAYGSDVRLVEKILVKVAENHSQIEKIPASFVRFNDFGDSSLDFQLYFWTSNDFLVENIKSDLRFEIDDQFRMHDIRIPFPQRDVHLQYDDVPGKKNNA